MTLTRRLTLILAGVICLTALAVVVPVYLIIRNELHQQIWNRLDDARQHSFAILDFERVQLQNTVELASERPTLQHLIEADDRAGLESYLLEFQPNTALDYLFVEVDGEIIGEQSPTEEVPLMSVTLSGPLSSKITGVIRLDNDLAKRLQLQTGFSYRFMNSGTPLASLTRTSGNTTYYGMVLALENPPGAVVEILLPVDEVLLVEQRAVGVLIGVTATVSVTVSLAVGVFLRYQIRPLWRLTQAAKRMGQGDLSTPVQTTSTLLEIATLAKTLESNREWLSRTLNELSKAKEWSESLIQSITEGIVTCDTDGVVVFFSEGASRITKITPEDAVGKRLNELFPLTNPQEGVFSEYIPAEGTRRTVNVRAPQGNITLAVSRSRQLEDQRTTLVLYDITDETQRRSLQAYFLANVSHEFRTPLAGMKVSIELLMENAPYLSGSEMEELHNSLYLSATSLQNLIDNLLESSKIEANHFSLRRQPTDLNQLLSDAVRLMQPFFNRRRQTLVLDQPLMLPPLKLDTTRMVQVLVNLLSNASKYSPMDSCIDILVEDRETTLYVAIADRGQGIPEEQREGIFKQFIRLESASKADYGAGLGLAVVKAIVEAHGGHVGVEGREGGGSMFWFTLEKSA